MENSKGKSYKLSKQVIRFNKSYVISHIYLIYILYILYVNCFDAYVTVGSKACPPWMTALLSVAALDLRPERGNQGDDYGGKIQRLREI